MDRLEQLLSERPRSFAPLAEVAFRLRDRLIEDLGTLEALLAQATSDEGVTDLDALDPDRKDQDVPLGDAVALGGQ